jgi:hypothetical protein
VLLSSDDKTAATVLADPAPPQAANEVDGTAVEDRAARRTGDVRHGNRGIYASGLTPLILTSLSAANHGDPWYACGYLVAAAVLSVGATVLLNAR